MTESLRQSWEAFHEEHPGVELREAAGQLNVSEAELVAAFLGEGSVRLVPDLLKSPSNLLELGTILFHCRNETVTLELLDGIKSVQSDAQQLIFKADYFTFYLFLKHLHLVFALHEEGGREERRSLQVFDGSGENVCKIFLTEKSPINLYESWLEKLSYSPQNSSISIVPPETGVGKEDHEVNQKELIKATKQLGNFSDYYYLPQSFGITPSQMLRLVKDQFSTWVTPYSLRRLFLDFMVGKLPVTIILCHRKGMLICTSIITKSDIKGLWLVAEGEGLKLKIRHTQIGSAWIVNLPFLDCPMLEFFDKTGESMFALSYLGEEKAQRKAWEQLLKAIPLQH